ncbi:MAG: trigger factor [Pseudomonadota bacterium]|nr:trigger factor [Pseudomonadota bacterium]
MQTEVQQQRPLERKLDFSFPTTEIETQVETRLKQIARTAKFHGFRPGKVPMKIVAQQYGGKVRQEVMSDSLQRSFADKVKQQNIRIAGYPRFEPKENAANDDSFQFTAVYEIYPDVVLGSVADKTIKRPIAPIGEAEIDKTIQVLRKQRVHFHPVTRAAQNGDQVDIDYDGQLDGARFEGGQAKGALVVLGEGRLHADFETSLSGMNVGESKTFDVTFPSDYHGTQVAGKTVSFSVTVNKVSEPHLPELNEDFAKAMGIKSGQQDELRADVRANLEREMKRRIQAKVKEQVMQLLLDSSTLEVPQTLIEMETRRLQQNALQDFQSRGLAGKHMALPLELFTEAAKRRAALGLIISEVVKQNKLEPKPEQVRAIIEEHSKSYEQPDAMVQWYYQKPEMLQEVQAVVMEDNVVAWASSQAKSEDVATPFDELMGTTK